MSAAGDALASAWDRVLSDDDLRDREDVRAVTLDSHVLNAVISIASSVSRGLAERRSALVVLTALYAPGKRLSAQFWNDPSTRRRQDWPTTGSLPEPHRSPYQTGLGPILFSYGFVH